MMSRRKAGSDKPAIGAANLRLAILSEPMLIGFEIMRED
jgi:hypothetical protein